MIGKRIEWTHHGSRHQMTGTVTDCSWSAYPDGDGDWELLVILDSGYLAEVSAIRESVKVVEDAPQKAGSLRDELINIINLPGVTSVDISLTGSSRGMATIIAYELPSIEKFAPRKFHCAYFDREKATEEEIASALRSLADQEWTKAT